jgi:hypothetical protein
MKFVSTVFSCISGIKNVPLRSKFCSDHVERRGTLLRSILKLRCTSRVSFFVDLTDNVTHTLFRTDNLVLLLLYRFMVCENFVCVIQIFRL